MASSRSSETMIWPGVLAAPPARPVRPPWATIDTPWRAHSRDQRLHLGRRAGQGEEAGGEVFRVMAGVDLVHAGFVAYPLGAEEGGQFGAKGFCGCGHGAPSMFNRA